MNLLNTHHAPEAESPYRKHFTRHPKLWRDAMVQQLNGKNSKWMSWMLRSYGIKRIVSYFDDSDRPYRNMSEMLNCRFDMRDGQSIIVNMKHWLGSRPWRYSTVDVIYDFIAMQAMPANELAMAAFDDPLAALALHGKRAEYSVVS